MVLVATRPQETETLTSGPVRGQQAMHVALEFVLGDKGLRQIHKAFHPELRRDVLIELVGISSPHGPEHLLFDVGHRVGDIGMHLWAFIGHIPHSYVFRKLVPSGSITGNMRKSKNIHTSALGTALVSVAQG
jgi:hypothetical protein